MEYVFAIRGHTFAPKKSKSSNGKEAASSSSPVKPLKSSKSFKDSNPSGSNDVPSVKDATAGPAAAPTKEEPKETLDELYKRLEALEAAKEKASDLKEVKARLVAENAAGPNRAGKAKLDLIAGVVLNLERLEAGKPYLIRKGDPRLNLKIDGLNGYEAMEALIQEMGYDMGSGTPDDDND